MRASVVMVFRAIAALLGIVVIVQLLARFKATLGWFLVTGAFTLWVLLFGLGTIAAWEKVKRKSSSLPELDRGELTGGEEILGEYPAECRYGLFGYHGDCKVVVTNKGLFFLDGNDKKYSFRLSRDVLTSAKIDKKYGTDLVIKLPDGTQHEIGLQNGLFDKIVSLIR